VSTFASFVFKGVDKPAMFQATQDGNNIRIATHNHTTTRNGFQMEAPPWGHDFSPIKIMGAELSDHRPKKLRSRSLALKSPDQNSLALDLPQILRSKIVALDPPIKIILSGPR
jgi:hypothetical protein